MTTQKLTLERDLHLEGGGSISRPTLAYQTWGTPNREATLVCHALTGNADSADWWSGFYQAGGVLDPDANFVVSVNVLGSCYGTTGPTSTDPTTDFPYGPTFPRVTVRDIVRSQREVLDHLGVDRLKLVIGGSLGGMQALEWGVMHPELVAAVAAIAVGPTQSAWAVGISDAQRSAIQSDTKFQGGLYDPRDPPAHGLATARMIAMISYRSPENFENRFGRNTDGDYFDVQAYLRYQGEKIVERFDANTYLTLMDAMDSHDVGRGRGGIARTLESLKLPVLAVGISTDVLYPPSEIREMASRIPAGVYRTLHAPQGHDAFLIETAQLDGIVSRFLEGIGTGDESGTDLPTGRGAAWA